MSNSVSDRLRSASADLADLETDLRARGSIIAPHDLLARTRTVMADVDLAFTNADQGVVREDAWPQVVEALEHMDRCRLLVRNLEVVACAGIADGVMYVDAHCLRLLVRLLAQAAAAAYSGWTGNALPRPRMAP